MKYSIKRVLESSLKLESDKSAFEKAKEFRVGNYTMLYDSADDKFILCNPRGDNLQTFAIEDNKIIKLDDDGSNESRYFNKVFNETNINNAHKFLSVLASFAKGANKKFYGKSVDNDATKKSSTPKPTKKTSYDEMKEYEKYDNKLRRLDKDYWEGILTDKEYEDEVYELYKEFKKDKRKNKLGKKVTEADTDTSDSYVTPEFVNQVEMLGYMNNVTVEVSDDNSKVVITNEDTKDTETVNLDDYSSSKDALDYLSSIISDMSSNEVLK